MWNNFEGLARTREQTLERINALQWTDWRPQGITLHNTAAPTLEQWAETGPRHDARIRNLQSFYENDKGWHAGPHWFVSRNWINWFSDPLRPGVHSRCFNATRFGIEMVGDYDQEEFNSGDGALVRDNAVFLIAALNLKFDFDPDDLKFHVECKKDNHDCPGKKVVKAEVISRVRAMMAALKSEPVMSARAHGVRCIVFGGSARASAQHPGQRIRRRGDPGRAGVRGPVGAGTVDGCAAEQDHAADRSAGGPDRDRCAPLRSRL